MNNTELVDLIDKTVDEVFELNGDIIKDYHLPDVIKMAVKLSCAANLKLLKELGVLNELRIEE